MCDTRTWVFKLLIGLLVIHCSRIQQCYVAGAPADGDATAAVGASSSIDDDDSFEAASSPGDTLSESQRSPVNSTINNARSSSNKDSAQSSSLSLSSSSSSVGSIADRLASGNGVAADGDEGPDVDDDDGSVEESNGSQRKFNNAAKDDDEADDRAPPVYGYLKRVEDEKDYGGESTPVPTPTGSAPVLWNGAELDDPAGDENDDDDDDEDVDEILQPMTIVSDKRRYNSNNGGRVMSPGVSYSTEFHSTGNGDEESTRSNSSEEPSSVTNRIKTAYPSAFEQHKALIRNNKRYGHKSHKKKYKDYLRYNPPTSAPLTTTVASVSPVQKGIIARDRIISSDDIPRSYYQGHVNYFTSNDDFDAFHDADKKEQSSAGHFRTYHSSAKHPASPGQTHTGGHLRSGGRYRHIGIQPKNQRPFSAVYPESSMINYHHLGSRAKQQHQRELEKKIDEYSQYYSKWPHLAQVEDQLFEDEQTDILYPEGDGTFSSPGELVLAADDSDSTAEKEEDDPNLPPYIKKYRRRNKQLLDLLEGTQPPSTLAPLWSSSVLKPGPVDGNHHQNYSPRHHLRSHRKHHHHRQHRNHQRSHRHKNPKWQIEDLFEEQRANPNNPNRTAVYSEAPSSATSTTTSTTTLSPFDELLKHENDHLTLLQKNQLPAEDVSISRELYDWAVEIGRDYPHGNDNTDDYIDQNHSGLASWKTLRNGRPISAITTTTVRPAASVRRPNVYGSVVKSPASSLSTSTAKPINSFVYHRVVEAPRVVGAGQTGRKQRLPFVAITDRRLETSKKGMGNAGPLAHKDYQQNHFPMP